MSAEPRKFNFDFSYWSHDGFKEEGNGYMVPDKSHANGNKYADQVGMTYRCLFELKCFASKKLSTGRDQHNWTGQDFRIFWLEFSSDSSESDDLFCSSGMGKADSLNHWKNTSWLSLLIYFTIHSHSFSGGTHTADRSFVILIFIRT